MAVNLSFGELYQKLCAQHKAPLEKMRRKLALKYSLIIGFCVVLLIVLIWVFYPLGKGTGRLVGIIVALIGGGLTFLCAKSHAAYVSYYKIYIIRNFIAMVDPNLTYSETITKSKEYSIMNLYYSAEFDSVKPNRISIDDLITGTAAGYPVELCDMNLYRKSGKYGRQLFLGLFAHIQTNKNIGGYIKITSDNLFESSNQIKLDDNEFEKCFDVSSSDRIMAMQYLTSDVMALLVRFKENVQIDFDMFWQGTDIVIRFKTGKMFEPKIFGDSMNMSTLQMNVTVLSLMLKLNNLVGKTIKTTEIWESGYG